MLNDSYNKQWKLDYFKIFATEHDNVSQLEEADKLKFGHFPPVIGNFYENPIDEESLKKICEGKLKLSKAKFDENYNDEIVRVDYVNTIKGQLNNLMKQQIAQLNEEDPTFLSDEEKKIIEEADFPFIRLMTLVYVKDTNEMTDDEQKEWKDSMNNFINQQILFGVVNTYYTMKLYQDNNYARLFQTPYNKQELWDEYANNKQGFCVVYDFKEISGENAAQLNKLYPILYTDKKLSPDDLNYEVNNSHCASLTAVKQEVKDYYNEWMYIFNHHFTEREYLMLDGMLEPIYSNTFNYEPIQNILKKNYLVPKDDDLEYDYRQIIDDIIAELESNTFQDAMNSSMEEVYKITDDEMEVDFLKPEAIYLGTNFPEDKKEEYKQLVEGENIRIFIIKEKDGKFFKALF